MLELIDEARRYVATDQPGAEIVESLLEVIEQAQPRVSRYAGMTVGESRFFPGVSAQSASTSARSYGLRRGMRFTVRKIAKGGEIGIKVTRVE